MRGRWIGGVGGPGRRSCPLRCRSFGEDPRVATRGLWMRRCIWRLLPTLMLGMTSPLWAGDPLWRIDLQPDAGEQAEVRGRVLVEAADGGLLVEDRSRRLWTIPPDHLVTREPTGQEFAPATTDELQEELQTLMRPAGGSNSASAVVTPHYVILSQGSREQAELCGVLLEGLLQGFIDFWADCGLSLQLPEGTTACVDLHQS